jgi:hypothetical protein
VFHGSGQLRRVGPRHRGQGRVAGLSARWLINYANNLLSSCAKCFFLRRAGPLPHKPTSFFPPDLILHVNFVAKEAPKCCHIPTHFVV